MTSLVNDSSTNVLSVLCDEVMQLSKIVHLLRQDFHSTLQTEIVEVLREELSDVKSALAERAETQKDLVCQNQRHIEASLSELQQEVRAHLGQELNGLGVRLNSGFARECQALRSTLTNQVQEATKSTLQSSLSQGWKPKGPITWNNWSPGLPKQITPKQATNGHQHQHACKNGGCVECTPLMMPTPSTPSVGHQGSDDGLDQPLQLPLAKCEQVIEVSPRESKLVTFNGFSEATQDVELAVPRKKMKRLDGCGGGLSPAPSERYAVSELKGVEVVSAQAFQGMTVLKCLDDSVNSALKAVGWANLGKVPHNPIATAAASGTFQVVSIFIILTNAVWMGVEVEVLMRLALREEAENPPDWFLTVNKTYVGIFVVELSFRLIGLRWSFFFGPDSRWNMLDFFLVLFGLVNTVLEANAQGQGNVNMVRMLRILRVCRALKIVRVLRFFRELQVMLCSIAASLASLSWSFGLLFIIIYIFSIFFMHGVIGEVEDMRLISDKDSISVAEKEEAAEWMAGIEEYYYSLYVTMVSMLMAISGGADWGEICRPLTKASRLYELAFMGYIVFVVFGVLNVLVGIFVSAAAENLDKELLTQIELSDRKKFTLDMKGLFSEFTSGETISREQFQESLAKVEIQAYMETNHLHFSDAQTLFALLDTDDSGEICLEEFVNGCQHLRGTARCSDMAFIVEQVKLQQEFLESFSDETQKQMRFMNKQLKLLTDGDG
mmetsp:Transcript_16781/g.38867  ORF Transcript_16781/g.38867 Transcript_16781/m.38867 type:complete len:722 (-) Transcript_16781:127-2292(-)